MHACVRPRCSADGATPAASLLIRTDRTWHLFLIRRDATDWPQLMFRARPTSSHALSARLRPQRCHIADAAICMHAHAPDRHVAVQVVLDQHVSCCIVVEFLVSTCFAFSDLSRHVGIGKCGVALGDFICFWLDGTRLTDHSWCSRSVLEQRSLLEIVLIVQLVEGHFFLLNRRVCGCFCGAKRAFCDVFRGCLRC